MAAVPERAAARPLLSPGMRQSRRGPARPPLRTTTGCLWSCPMRRCSRSRSGSEPHFSLSCLSVCRSTSARGKGGCGVASESWPAPGQTVSVPNLNCNETRSRAGVASFLGTGSRYAPDTGERGPSCPRVVAWGSSGDVADVTTSRSTQKRGARPLGRLVLVRRSNAVDGRGRLLNRREVDVQRAAWASEASSRAGARWSSGGYFRFDSVIGREVESTPVSGSRSGRCRRVDPTAMEIADWRSAALVQSSGTGHSA